MKYDMLFMIPAHEASHVHFLKALSAAGFDQVLDAVVRKGQAEILWGRLDSAAETFRLARQLNPFEPEVRLWLGYVLLIRGDRKEGVGELLAASKRADPSQRMLPHWRAWVTAAQKLSGRSGAANASSLSRIQSDSRTWTEMSGWSLWLQRIQGEPQHELSKRFLNIFPEGYQKSVGSSGLDLLWWNPRILEKDAGFNS